MLVPVSSKKVLNTLNWKISVRPQTPITTSESMARSVTTVPSALANDTPSYLLSTPQRVNSPMRGTRRLAAYERKTELTHVPILGRSPRGSSVCLHRHPRNACARMPKGKESNIHVQSISSSMNRPMRLKSNPRYIQYSMAPPSTSGSNILTVTFVIFLISISSAKIHYFNRKTKKKTVKHGVAVPLLNSL